MLCAASSMFSLPNLTGADTPHKVADLAALAQEIRSRFGCGVRTVAITAAAVSLDQPGVALLHDAHGAFAYAYGTPEASFLIRPDGYIGWRGLSWRGSGLLAHLS